MYSRVVKSAFTLVELLTVLSVISFLFSFLLPCLRKAREQARTIVCASNMKNNYYLLSTYSNDYNGNWPKTDYSYDTNQFYRIGSPNIHGPVYYLWRCGYLAKPDTWYCPSGKDNLEDNWYKNDKGILVPNENLAVSGYQYRMFFAYNWPDVRKTAMRKKHSIELLGYLNPALHNNVALWVDAFGADSAGRNTNHSISNLWNVLFNDSCVKRRLDAKDKISQLDLSWWQAGDWRIPLPDGKKDNLHNAALLWHFFDTGSWDF